MALKRFHLNRAKRQIKLALWVFVLAATLTLNIGYAQDGTPLLSPEEYFAEVTPGYTSLSTYFGGEFCKSLIQFQDDDTIGIVLDIPDVDGSNTVAFTVKGYDQAQILEYLNTTQVYFDVQPIDPADLSLFGGGDINHFDDILLDAIAEENGIGAEEFEAWAQTVCAGGEGSIEGLLSPEAFDAAVERMLAVVDIDISNGAEIEGESENGATPPDFETIREAYATIDLCDLIDDTAPAPDPDAVTVIIEVLKEEDDQLYALYFSIDPPLAAGQIVDYGARRIRGCAWARAIADDGNVTLTMWRFNKKTGRTLWSDSETDEAGAPEPRWLQSCKLFSKWYDVRVTSNQDGSVYTIDGGWAE